MPQCATRNDLITGAYFDMKGKLTLGRLVSSVRTPYQLRVFFFVNFLDFFAVQHIHPSVLISFINDFDQMTHFLSCLIVLISFKPVDM